MYSHWHRERRINSGLEKKAARDWRLLGVGVPLC